MGVLDERQRAQEAFRLIDAPRARPVPGLEQEDPADDRFLGGGMEVVRSASCNLGISAFPTDGTDCETLIKTADMAMCASIEDGLNGFRVFTEEMNDKVQEALRLEQGLRDALANRELFLVYQPQVDVRTGRVTGLEALLRWDHPQWGLVLPGKFIGVAEISGLIVPIGEWVLRTACAPGAQVAGCRSASRPDRGQCIGDSVPPAGIRGVDSRRSSRDRSARGVS